MAPKKGERVFSKDYGAILIGIAKVDWLSALSLAETMKGRPENALFLAQQASPCPQISRYIYRCM